MSKPTKNPPIARRVFFDSLLCGLCCCLCFQLAHTDSFGLAVGGKGFLALNCEESVLGLSGEVVT